MSFLWNEVILNPMINALLWLYGSLGNNFILALTVFTVGIRVIMIPLSLRSQRSTLRAQEMQPQIKEIQKKYRDNPQKMQEEFQKIGYNPTEQLSGCLPLLLQMPVLFGLYRAIFYLLGATPQSMFELGERVYSGIDLSALLPIGNQFLWMNLGQPDPLLVLPILVFVSMFVQQKLMSPTRNNDDNNKKKSAEDDPTAAMTQSMQYVMPVMFGIFSLQFAAGLSIYFVLANIIGIGQGYYMRRAMAEAKAEAAAKKKNDAVLAEAPPKQPKSAKKSIKASPNGAGQSKNRAKPRKNSKRKRRSAKR